MALKTQRPIPILSIEDNGADRALVRTAFTTLDANVTVQCVSTGDEALKYLNKLPPFETAERPKLILLDLNLPGKHGKEVLFDIKNDPELVDIPVIVLTCSNALQDVTECYQLKANCYLVKPMNFEEFLELVSSINQFWVKRVTFSARSKEYLS